MNYGLGTILYFFWDGFSGQAATIITPDIVFTLPARSMNFTEPARNLNFTLPQR